MARPKNGDMRINVPVTIAVFIVLFIVGVVALTMLGKPLLTELSFDNTTVGYIDLARQAATKRDYAKAESLYQEAISNAERVSPNGQNTVFALVTYAEYLKSRKRPAEAQVYETRAYRISHP
ncbi:MAG: tetratricopeptide repeat protein [Candidatus Obscuribacterales bacterium]